MTYRIRRSLVSDTEVLGRVCSQAWQETYASIVPAESLAKAGSVERRTQTRRDFFENTTPDWLHLLAETKEGEIVGFCDCGPADELKNYAPAEICTIYLLRAAQGRGLGKKMLLMMLKHLAERGFESAVLGVLGENEKARHFYEGMGGKRVKEFNDDFFGPPLPTAVYVWSDLKKFA